MLENKLGITNAVELAREEEKISKKKAALLFESGYLDSLEPGTYETLAKIHKYLFEDIYGFAGELRQVNLAKSNFRFAPMMYLKSALENIGNEEAYEMLDTIMEKHVERHSSQNKNSTRNILKQREWAEAVCRRNYYGGSCLQISVMWEGIFVRHDLVMNL